MRQPFAHDALVTMAASEDERALGEAITRALCGRIDHPPPCPWAPHHTDAQRRGDQVRLRVLFAAQPCDEDAVRQSINAALAQDHLISDEALAAQWRLLDARASPVRQDEAEHADRLVRS